MLRELLDVVALGDFSLPFGFFTLVECATDGFKPTVLGGDKEDRIDVLL